MACLRRTVGPKIFQFDVFFMQGPKLFGLFFQETDEISTELKSYNSPSDILHKNFGGT